MVLTSQNYQPQKLSPAKTRTWISIPSATGTLTLASKLAINEVTAVTSGGNFYGKLEFNSPTQIDSGAIRVGDYIRVSSSNFIANSKYAASRAQVTKVYKSGGSGYAEYQLQFDASAEGTVASVDLFLLTTGSRFLLSGVKTGVTENTGNIYFGVFGEGYTGGQMDVYPFKVTPGQTFVLEAPAGASISLDNIQLKSATSGDGLTITYF